LIEKRGFSAHRSSLKGSEDETKTGAKLHHLPPYSPDFSPIENAFSKLEALLRARAERTIDALWDAAGEIVALFKPTECANYSAACGYDPK
jgi:transposase